MWNKSPGQVGVVCPRRSLMSQKSQGLARLLDGGQVIFLPICGFGSAVWKPRLNQSVSDKTSIDCLMCDGGATRARGGKKKPNVGSHQRGDLFQSFFFAFFFNGN